MPVPGRGDPADGARYQCSSDLLEFISQVKEGKPGWALGNGGTVLVSLGVLPTEVGYRFGDWWLVF